MKIKKGILSKTNINKYVAYFYNEMTFNKVNDSSNRNFDSAVSKSHKRILIDIKE